MARNATRTHPASVVTVVRDPAVVAIVGNQFAYVTHHVGVAIGGARYVTAELQVVDVHRAFVIADEDGADALAHSMPKKRSSSTSPPQATPVDVSVMTPRELPSVSKASK